MQRIHNRKLAARIASAEVLRSCLIDRLFAPNANTDEIRLAIINTEASIRLDIRQLALHGYDIEGRLVVNKLVVRTARPETVVGMVLERSAASREYLGKHRYSA